MRISAVHSKSGNGEGGSCQTESSSSVTGTAVPSLTFTWHVRHLPGERVCQGWVTSSAGWLGMSILHLIYPIQSHSPPTPCLQSLWLLEASVSKETL